MTRSRSVFFLALVVLALSSCRKTPSAPETLSEAPTTQAAEEDPPAPIEVAPPEATEPQGNPEEAPTPGDVPEENPAKETPESPLPAFSVTLAPEQLDVMRDTEVTLTLKSSPEGLEGYSCLWDPGDDTGKIEGCSATHRYAGGLVDRTVSLKVLSGDSLVFERQTPLRLERLTVVPLPDEPGEEPVQALDDLPSPPGDDQGLRLAVAGLFSDEPTDGAAFLNIIEDVEPDIVVLFLNWSVSPEEANQWVEAVSDRTRCPVVPIPVQRQDGDWTTLRALPGELLSHGESQRPPGRHAFLYRGSLFAVLDGSVREVSKSQEKWLLAELESGKIASHRMVLSPFPLSPLDEAHLETLTPDFRYYEKLLRGDTTLLVSSNGPVFYYGRYGQVPAVTVGCATGKPGALLGDDTLQPRTITVIDLAQEQPPLVLAVGVDEGAVMPPVRFPKAVGKYERID